MLQNIPKLFCSMKFQKKNEKFVMIIGKGVDEGRSFDEEWYVQPSLLIKRGEKVVVVTNFVVIIGCLALEEVCDVLCEIREAKLVILLI